MPADLTVMKSVVTVKTAIPVTVAGAYKDSQWMDKMIKYICEKCGCEQHCGQSCTECMDCPDCDCKQCNAKRK